MLSLTRTLKLMMLSFSVDSTRLSLRISFRNRILSLSRLRSAVTWASTVSRASKRALPEVS